MNRAAPRRELPDPLGRRETRVVEFLTRTGSDGLVTARSF